MVTTGGWDVACKLENTTSGVIGQENRRAAISKLLTGGSPELALRSLQASDVT